MRVNFLAMRLASGSGGEVYDKHLYGILCEVFPQTRLFIDTYFVQRYQSGSGLMAFNRYYRDSIEEILDCDYLVMNSRLYTRFMLLNLAKELSHRKTKCIVIHHHSNFMIHHGAMRWLHYYLEAKVIKAADTLVIPNAYVIDQVKRDFKRSNIVSLPSSFEKKEYPLSHGEGKYLLSVGNVEYRKGLWYGLRAFKKISAQYPEYVYRIAGQYEEHDPYYQKLVSYVKRHHLEGKVVFEGRVDEERLMWLYSHASLFLFPSLLEGYGWVMAEAMARGVPVVAFENSAMPYTVKNGYNGLLVKNKDSSRMAEAACRLLKDDSLMERMRQGARETFDHLPGMESLNKLTRAYFTSWRSGMEGRSES